MNTLAVHVAVVSFFAFGASSFAVPATRQAAGPGREAAQAAHPDAGAVPGIPRFLAGLVGGAKVLRGDQSAALPTLQAPLAQTFWSPTRAELLRARVDSKSVRFEVQGAAALPRGAWEIGELAYPNHVQIKEFPAGDIIVAARVAAGKSEVLALGWLQWDWSVGGAAGLGLRGMTLVDSIRLGPGAPAEGPLDATSIDGIEALDWNPREKQVSLLLQIWGTPGAAQVVVPVPEERSARAAGLTAWPWWSAHPPGSVEAVWIGAGRDARAIQIGSESFGTLRALPSQLDLGPNGALGRLLLYRAAADGTWQSLAVSGGAPLVLNGYAVWANRSGALCVSTPVPGTDGAAGSAIRTFALKASADGSYSWKELRSASAPGDCDWSQRLALEDPAGPAPRLAFVTRDGSSLAVPVVE